MNPFEEDERLFAIAMDIAKDAHKGQTRKNSNEPYINHPIRVAEGFKDVTEFYLTALLHDVVEDSHWTLDMLRERGIPERVVEAVDALTRRDGESYLDFILRAGVNSIANVVKAADINDNLRDLKKGSLKDKYLMAKWILGRAMVMGGRLTFI